MRAERETADRRAGVRELSSGPEDEKISRVPVGPGPPTPHHTTEHVRDSFRADTVTDLAGVAAIPTYYSEAARILIRSALHAL